MRNARLKGDRVKRDDVADAWDVLPRSSEYRFRSGDGIGPGVYLQA